MQSINRDEVKMLALNVGVREAARQLGLNEDRVLQWSKRGEWFKPVPRPPAQGDVITVIKPAQALAETIAANGHETRLGLSEYAKRQAQHLATKGKLKDHGAFRNLASGSSTLHGWNENAGQAQFSLNVLNLGGSVQIGVRNDQPTE